MNYPVVLHPDKLLKKQAKKVEAITEELIVMLDNMYETMVAHDGVGLAAPQIGRSLRIAVIQADEEDDILELINPEIVSFEGETIDVEACLSIPGKYGLVPRHDRIVIRYFDREGVEYELEADDYFSRIIQHEMDHLDGILFIDKATRLMSEEEMVQYMEELEND
ncbi:peptide deformylase [Vagococcus xieshaowenii]|uniref:Peptide deformylase n=1 Tax=Vagococcus xieshaowenii TaxID=2562451 RepID=A0AAJ5EDT6_9ENTE|nr:peptide deformylase [Vagococcus xieshaowenii]QCA28935.1 peptide deformylase [Vagococcus xieshaowenii]TFZ39253.1 peptide deformylase [Vagococcus xieshaowenii]